MWRPPPGQEQATQTDQPLGNYPLNAQPLGAQPQADGIGQRHSLDPNTATDPPNVSGRVTQRVVTRVKQAVLDDLEAGPDGAQKLFERLPPRVVEMLPRALLAGGADQGVSMAIIQSIQSIDGLLFGAEEDKRRLLDAVRTLNVRCVVFVFV